MKNLLLLTLLTSFIYASPLQVLPFVSAQKFSGLWYEIARTYNSFQDKCVGSSVEYILNEQNEYEVYNRCFDTKIGGKLIEFNGSAEGVQEKENVAKLDMTYFWIFTKRYEIYYLEEDYSAALVADKELDQLWIMSRTPRIDEKKLQNILALLEGKMDLQRLIYTPQDTQGRYK